MLKGIIGAGTMMRANEAELKGREVMIAYMEERAVKHEKDRTTEYAVYFGPRGLVSVRKDRIHNDGRLRKKGWTVIGTVTTGAVRV